MRIHIPIHLRWADLDAYNHLNNVEMLRLLEEARVRMFWVPGSGDDQLREFACAEGLRDAPVHQAR